MEQRGFSLVELMVTVGIIGTLASLAVPNYLEHVARSRQTEAKNDLAALYGVEQAYAIEAGGYTLCINNIGFKPGGGQGGRYYAVGFTKTDAGNPCGSYKNPDTANNIQYNCNQYLESTSGPSPSCDPAAFATPATLKINSSASANLAVSSLPVTSISSSSFTAGAAGNIRNKPEWDLWTIDQTKTLKNLTPIPSGTTRGRRSSSGAGSSPSG